jgi:glycerate kinase
VRLARIEPPKLRPFPSEVTVAVDVQNRLLGPAGCSRVYGPQKGLKPEDFGLAEACLERLAAVARQQFGFDAAAEPGSGAAGGLGFGLRAFFGARLESGFQLFAADGRLEERINAAEVVVTGEGAIDRSTLMGKGVGEVALLCRKHGVPCLGLAGTLALDPVAGDRPELFTQLHGIVPSLASDEQAKAEAERWLARLAAVAAKELSTGV